MLEQLLVIIHILSAISVVGLILLQQGKGADMGASFGSGASQTVLGVQGGGNFLTHATAILTTIFFVTSMSLGYYAKQKSMVNTEEVIIEQTLDDSGVANEEVPASVNNKAVPVPVAAQTAVVAPQPEVAAPAEVPVAPAAPEEIPE